MPPEDNPAKQAYLEDIDEREMYPDDFEELNRNEADDYREED